MKRILFFVSPYFGGASRMVITISKLLDRSKYDVKYIIIGKEVCEIVNFLPKDYPWRFLKIRSVWDFTTLRLIQLFHREKPDYVFSSFMYLNSRVIAASLFFRETKVLVRNNNGLSTLRFDNKLLVKLTYPYADKVIVQQEDMKKELLSMLPCINNKIVVLNNYLDTGVIDTNLTAQSPYMNDNEIRFVWAGRVTKQKGYEVLLKAFNIVNKELPNAHLYLLGKYSEQDVFYQGLINYINKNNLHQKVHFKGLVSNPHVYEKFANCFVLPSFVEGLPNALIEAMYIGVPVVATSCIPIIEKIVDEGKNGFVVAPGDFVNMAKAMLKAVSLKNCHTIYKSSPKEDYIKLFES